MVHEPAQSSNGASKGLVDVVPLFEGCSLFMPTHRQPPRTRATHRHQRGVPELADRHLDRGEGDAPGHQGREHDRPVRLVGSGREMKKAARPT